MRFDRPQIVVVAACLLLLAGCGRFADPDQAAEPVEVGEPAVAPTAAEHPADVTTTMAITAAPAPRSETDPAQATASTGAPQTSVANAASAVTDGLEVEVVAEGGPAYGSHPHFRIQVTLRNHSDRTRHYFLGQGNFAAIADDAGAVVWRSGDCNPTLETYEISGGTAPLEPGEEVPVIVPYPAPESGSSDECHLPDGSYTLHGLFPVCPEEHVEETANPGTYSCPEEEVRQLASAGLPITIRGS